MTDSSPHGDSTFPVVVIGGGLAGLVAAAHLAEKGIQPVVLEADSLWPGGRLSGGELDTFEYNGLEWAFRPDHGVHALWGGYVNMRAMLGRFTDTALSPSLGEEWINRWGKDVRVLEAGRAVQSRWIPAPFHYLQLLFDPHIWYAITPLDFLSLPGFLFSMLWAVGMDPIREQSALDGLTMRDFFRGWTPNLRATFVGLGRNLLAAPSEAISLTALIAALRFYTVLRRDSWAMQYLPGNSHDTLIQPLVDAIEARGGKVMRGVTAVRLERDDDAWRIVVEDSARQGLRSLTADHVVLATNAPSAERLLRNSPAAVETSRDMPFPGAVRSAAVRIWFSRSPREGTPGGMFTGDFEPDNFFWLHRLYDEFKPWHDETGGSAIEVHFYGSEALMEQDDRHFLILAVDEVQRAFPELRRTYVHGVVRRNSRTHTRFRVPTRESLHVQTPWPNLYACGDWIGYPTPSLWMERATVTGIAAANAVLADEEIDGFDILQPKRPELVAVVLGLLVRLIRLIFSPVVVGLRWVRRQLRERPRT